MSGVPESMQVLAALASVPGGLLGALVYEGRGQPAMATDEAVLLQYSPRGRRLLALCALSFAVIGVIQVAYALLGEHPVVRTTVEAVLAVLSILFGVRLWRQRGFVVHADSRGITVRNAARPPQTIAWPDLHLVELSLSPRGCRLQGANGLRVRFPGTLPGMTELLTRIRRNVPSVRWRRWGRSVQSFQEGQKLHERRP